MEKGTKIIYITGNHDEFLREIGNSKFGNLQIVNEYFLQLSNEKIWIFHGDLIDSVIHRTKWLAKLGAFSYGVITIINKAINQALYFLGLKQVMLYKKMKTVFVSHSRESSGFEEKLLRLATHKRVTTVICGHTHSPVDKRLFSEKHSIRYLNSGDWVESFSAVEYENNNWYLRFFNANDIPEKDADDYVIHNSKELFNNIKIQLALLN